MYVCKRRLIAAFFAVVLGLSVFSCGKREPTRAGAVLSAMLASAGKVPAGILYFPEAEAGEQGYLSTELCAALYGEGEIPAEWELVSDYALYLSAANHPFELAVFRCDSGDGREELVALCMRRLAVLRKHFRGSDYEEYTSGGCIVTVGSYVLMVVSASSRLLIEEAQEVIG